MKKLIVVFCFLASFCTVYAQKNDTLYQSFSVLLNKLNHAKLLHKTKTDLMYLYYDKNLSFEFFDADKNSQASISGDYFELKYTDRKGLLWVFSCKGKIQKEAYVLSYIPRENFFLAEKQYQNIYKKYCSGKEIVEFFYFLSETILPEEIYEEEEKR